MAIFATTRSAAAVLVFACSLASPAVGQFLQVGDIQGESEDPEHEGWIKIETVNLSPTGQPTRGRAAPATGPGMLTVTRSPDSSSLPLREACNAAEQIPEIVLDVRTESTGDSIEYVLSDAVIQECDQATSGTRRIETITFEYQSLAFRAVRAPARPASSPTVNPSR